MSTSLIISLAFFMGLTFSYKLLKNVAKTVLDSKRNKSKFTSAEVEKFKKDTLECYRKFYEKYKGLDSEVNEIMNKALDKANGIMKRSKRQIDQALDDNIRSNLKKVTDQVEKVIGDLQVNTASIAAEAVRKIIQEHRDDKCSSEFISTILRNLNKKLH